MKNAKVLAGIIATLIGFAGLLKVYMTGIIWGSGALTAALLGISLGVSTAIIAFVKLGTVYHGGKRVFAILIFITLVSMFFLGLANGMIGLSSSCGEKGGELHAQLNYGNPFRCVLPDGSSTSY